MLVMTPPGERDHDLQPQVDRPLTAPGNSAAAKASPPTVATTDHRHRRTHPRSPDTPLPAACPPGDHHWPCCAQETPRPIVADVYHPGRGGGWRPSWRVGRRWAAASPAEGTGAGTRAGIRVHHCW